jgi:hypothetical protein
VKIYVAAFPQRAGKWLVGTGSWPPWKSDGSELFFLDSNNRLVSARVEARENAFGIGTLRPLFTIEVPGSGYPYDVSPDGRRFVINDADEMSGGTLSFIINWPSVIAQNSVLVSDGAAFGACVSLRTMASSSS